MTTKFVSTTGNNTNPGTQISPYLTWQKGLENIVAGDTLYIRGGTYAQKVNSSSQTVPVGTSFVNAPIIAGYPGETVVLAPTTDSGLKLNQDQYQIWKDFVIDCTLCTDDGIDVGGGTSRSIRFQNVEVKNIPAATHANLILAWGDKDVNGYFEFIDCIVHGNADSNAFGHGVYINSPHCLVDGLTVYSCTNFGLHAFSNASFPDESTSDLTARRVRAYSNNVGILISGGDNNLLHSSISYSNTSDGVVAEFGTASNLTKFGKVVSYGNGGRGIRIGGNQSNALIRNCIGYLNTGGNYSDAGSATVQDHNLFGVDPLFINPATGDFRVSANSPAVDAGIDQSQYYNTDFAGNIIV